MEISSVYSHDIFNTQCQHRLMQRERKKQQHVGSLCPSCFASLSAWPLFDPSFYEYKNTAKHLNKPPWCFTDTTHTCRKCFICMTKWQTASPGLSWYPPHSKKRVGRLIVNAWNKVKSEVTFDRNICNRMWAGSMLCSHSPVSAHVWLTSMHPLQWIEEADQQVHEHCQVEGDITPHWYVSGAPVQDGLGWGGERHSET